MIPEFVRLSGYIAVTTLIGFGIICLIPFKNKISLLTERLFLSYGIGVGFISLEMLLFYLLGMKFSLTNILAPWAMLLIINLLIYFKGRKKIIIDKTTGMNPEGSGFLKIFLTLGITFEVFYAFFRAFIKPMEAYDAIAIYAIKAKAFYLASSIPQDFFYNLALFLPHPDYPLNIPLAETFVYLFLGSLNDQLVKIIFPLFFVGILGILYSGIRRFASNAYALLFTFILASIPQFSSYAANGYLDIVLAYYYFASALFLFLWFKNVRDYQFLLVSGIMAGLAAWTKNEGSMYCVINIVLIAIYLLENRANVTIRKSIIYLCGYIFVVLILLSGWLWIKTSAHLVNDEIDLARLNPYNLSGQYSRIWPIIYEFQKQFLGPKKWNIVWIIFIFLLLGGIKRAFSKDIKYITLSIFFAFGGYILIYMITSQNIAWHLSSTASRFFIHFLPVVIYWFAAMLKEDLKV